MAATLVLLPLAWIVPDWIGSGHPLDGGRQARSEPVWSLSLAEQPWLRALERVHNHGGPAIELLMAVAVVGAIVRRRLAVLALAAAALFEVALFVAMTEAGFSGNPRYVPPALALACVLAGVGAANMVQAGADLAVHRPRLPAPTGAGLAVAAVALLVASLVGARGSAGK